MTEKQPEEVLTLCGAEALIRVRHPTWGLVPPAYFMPDRDDPCLSVLSNFVINRAIEDWHYFTTQHRAVQIAVNLPFRSRACASR